MWLCIDGMSPFDFAEVVVSEGRSHPSDRRAGAAAGKPVAAGWLRYEANALLEAQLKE